MTCKNCANIPQLFSSRTSGEINQGETAEFVHMENGVIVVDLCMYILYG